MKTRITVSLFALVLATGGWAAQDAHHPQATATKKTRTRPENKTRPKPPEPQKPRSGKVDVSLPPFPAGTSDSVTVALLDGSSTDQQTFLQALAAAPKKGTFICENLANQKFATRGYRGETDQTLSLSETGTTWPYLATVVGCGTVTLKEHADYQDLDNQYRVGFWGTVEIQPNLETQGGVAGLGFVDYCPLTMLVRPSTCETTVRHPIPPPRPSAATIEGDISLTLNVDGSDSSKWRIIGIEIAFVPSTDHSSQAQELRNTGIPGGRAVPECRAMDAVQGDPRIVTAISGQSGNAGNYDTRTVHYRMTVGGVTPPYISGEVFACSSDMTLSYTRHYYDPNSWNGQGTYYGLVENHDISWYGRFVTVRPDADVWQNFSADSTVYPKNKN